MELQAQPVHAGQNECALRRRAASKPRVKFEGHAVMITGANAADLQETQARRASGAEASPLLQFDGEPDWQLTLGNRTLARPRRAM